MSAFLETMLNDTYVKPVYVTLDDCLQQGQAAYQQCYRREENPYPVGTGRREWWDAGYIGEQEELLGTP